MLVIASVKDKYSVNETCLCIHNNEDVFDLSILTPPN